MEDKNILIIDDDSMITDMYTGRFELAGFTVHIAHDGKEGVLLAKELKPDIIITDIMMPKKDGFFVAEQLKSSAGTKNIPLVVLTNLGNLREEERMKKIGAIGFFVKANYTPSMLLCEILKILKPRND